VSANPGVAPPRVRVLPPRRPGRWLVAMLALAAVAYVVWAFATAPSIKWNAVANYYLDGRIIDGLWLTIVLTLSCMAVGVVGGVTLAVMRLSSNRVLQWIAWWYLLLFRGTPVLVQIILWFNLSLVFPTIGTASTNDVITPFTAAVLGLGLNEAAYMAEIVRAGIQSVDEGQSEATAATGLTRGQALRYVVLPQAMRAITPPTGNQFIGMLKSTSLVSVIGSEELLTQAQHIYGENFLTIELLLVTCIWYLILTSVSTVIQYFVETKLSSGDRRPKSIVDVLRRSLHLRPPDALSAPGGARG
jgi:polar amino acid transport system permease protein